MQISVAYYSPLYLRRAFTDGNLSYGAKGAEFYAFDRPVIVNPNTSQQQRSRSAWKESSAVWRGLSTDVKARWSDFAKKRDREFGHETLERLNGYRLFQASAGYRQILGLPIRTEAPVVSPPAGLSGLELLPSPRADTFRFRVTHSHGAGDGLRVIVSMTPATFTVARAPERNNARHIKGWGVDSSAPLPESGGVVEFTGVRFPVAAGRRFGVWIRVVRESDGLARKDQFYNFIRPAMLPDDNDFVDNSHVETVAANTAQALEATPDLAVSKQGAMASSGPSPTDNEVKVAVCTSVVVERADIPQNLDPVPITTSLPTLEKEASGWP